MPKGRGATAGFGGGIPLRGGGRGSAHPGARIKDDLAARAHRERRTKHELAAETLRRHLPTAASDARRIAEWSRRFAGVDLSERAPLRQLGFVDDGTSWVRPPNASLLATMAPQAVPRRVLQMGATFASAAAKHGRYMHGWWALNPEYEYRFFTDAQCGAYVQQHGQSGRLGGATAGHHGLLRLHLKA